MDDEVLCVSKAHKRAAIFLTHDALPVTVAEVWTEALRMSSKVELTTETLLLRLAGEEGASRRPNMLSFDARASVRARQGGRRGGGAQEKERPFRPLQHLPPFLFSSGQS